MREHRFVFKDNAVFFFWRVSLNTSCSLSLVEGVLISENSRLIVAHAHVRPSTINIKLSYYNVIITKVMTVV